MKILKHLTDYREPLEKVRVGTKTYRTNKEFNPSLIVAQSFGADLGETSYNAILADTLKNSTSVFGELPAVVQSEVGSCLERIDYSNFCPIGTNYGSGEGSVLVSKISTDDVLKLSRKLIDEWGLDPKRVLYVAHPSHIYRVMELGKRAGLDGFPFIPDKVEWPANDSQPWVRSSTRWIFRELFLARVHDRIC